jgi:hypothetical protein
MEQQRQHHMKDTLDQAVNLFILIIILGLGLLSFLLLSGNQAAQLMVGIVIAVAYSVWGLLHHWIIADLHQKVVIEYVLVGALAVTMLLMLLNT